MKKASDVKRKAFFIILKVVLLKQTKHFFWDPENLTLIQLMFILVLLLLLLFCTIKNSYNNKIVILTTTRIIYENECYSLCFLPPLLLYSVRLCSNSCILDETEMFHHCSFSRIDIFILVQVSGFKCFLFHLKSFFRSQDI